MKKITYPILSYKIRTDAILGILVGTDFQLVERDINTLKSSFQSYLTQQYKKHNDYWIINIQQPKLKVIEIPVRPTFKEEGNNFPMNQDLRVPMPCVYGENQQGYFECYLPLLDGRFFYYDPKQFKSLVLHFGKDILGKMAPEQLCRMMLYESPQLETISLRVNTNKTQNYNPGNYNTPPQTLIINRLAEEYPHPKDKIHKSLPETAWELEDLVAELIDKLVYQDANILVVGNTGAGKSAILKQAFKQISNQVRKGQLSMSFWGIMSQRITAASKYLGDWQNNCEQLVEELKLVDGVLWVQDLIQMIRIGGQGAEDSVAAFLLPYLQQGELQIIGELTPPELESMRQFLPTFVEHFQIIQVEELSESKIISILNQFAAYIEKSLKIKIPQESIMLVYRLLSRYYPYESFPGKAINFLGKCVSQAQLDQEKIITKTKILDVFIEKTGLPELFLRDDYLLDKEDLQEHFDKHIIGQTKAVTKMMSIIKIFKVGLNNPYKPIHTFLFAGPTGVGKTASAKALANYFFGKGQKQSPLIRIDMSEFQHPGMIHRFIGAGKEVGKLVQLVREKPFSVLLLDEVEKADPSIFDALLSVLDEGRFVDAFGRITSFRNTIIIMTTNLGASNRNSIGFGNKNSDETAYTAAISRFFRPEFVNRIDSLVFFNPLTQEDIQRIVKIELEQYKQREGLQKRQLSIQFSENLIKRLIKIGFDEKYGARPLQRAIENVITSPLANWLLINPAISGRKLLLDFEDKLLITLL